MATDEKTVVKYAIDHRPGFGKRGKLIPLVSNHHRVRLDRKIIHHYDVTITPEPRKGTHFRVMSESFKKNKELFGEVTPAYDGNKSFFAPKSLNFQQQDLEVIVSEDDAEKSRTRKYTLSMKHVGQIDTFKMQQYLDGAQMPLPQEVLQVFDLALRQVPRQHFVERGRSFYNPHFGKKDFEGGLVAHCGFFQSLRPAQDKLLTLNLDIAALPFLQPNIELIKFIGQNLRRDPRDLDNVAGRNTNDGAVLRTKLKRLLKDVRVQTTHTKHKYTIKKITEMPLEFLKFESDGQEISVADYFNKQYKFNLNYRGFPAIEAGTKDRKRYIPMELCVICPDQPYVKTLTDFQRSGLLALTCLSPEERKQRTAKISEELRKAVGNYVSNFGIQINSMLTPVNGRVLDPPLIKYKNDSEMPRSGTWNMKGKVIFKGVKISTWTAVNFSNAQMFEVENFCNQLPKLCNQYGLSMNPKMAAKAVEEHNGNIEGVLKHQKRVAEETSKLPLDFILCVMPQKDNKNIYATIKKVCELDLGISTQCCLGGHVQKCRPDYIANVILKINAKLGGQNSLLDDEAQKRLPLISQVPSMIIGSDVSHSGPGEYSASSISSVVATMDWPSFSKYKAIICPQKRGSELFEDLYWEKEDEQGRKQTGGIFKELLSAFLERTGNVPERILYYRDGVSDGQFEKTLNNEMGMLKKACEAMGWGENGGVQEDQPASKKPRLGKSPKVTFIVAQKRHHTRFFPDMEKRCPTLKNGNILPGTVVDQTVCQPSIFDFYLCSHAGIKGTSKPTHYHVLKDENGFSVDDIQKLTNDLCFTYARCTRSVSVVPACYYAHLAAKRGKVWVDYDSFSDSGSVHSRSSGGGSVLKPIHGQIKESMFYI